MFNAQLAALAQDAQPQAAGPTYTFHSDVNIVLTNVVVRDKKTGEIVKGLKASDFQIFENKKPQKVSSFDFQTVDQAAVLAEKGTVTGKASIADLLERNFAATPQQLRDHRLIVIFFDLSSMQDEDIDRAVDAATNYVNKQMQPADLVALVSMSTGLTMDQDFTSDKIRAAARPSRSTTAPTPPGSRPAAPAPPTAPATTPQPSPPTTPSTTASTPTASCSPSAPSPRASSASTSKKSMLYFSGGLTRNGIENQASLRAATNEAAKANMAIYSVDTRGLQALPPVGDASKGSLRGNCRLQRQRRAGAVQRQLRFAGDPRHPQRRYRRQGLLRLQRLRPRLPAGPARYRGLLHPRLQIHQPGARWQLPPPHRQGESPRRQAGVPPRLLRPRRLPAPEDRRPRTRAHRTDAQRPSRHRCRRSICRRSTSA